MLIIVNRNAGGGKGFERWFGVEAALREKGLPFEVRVTASPEEADAALADGLSSGEVAFAAAGGDGGVNHMLNALIDPATDRPRVAATLGAVGLGSSNDFHKPRRPERDVAGCPARLDVTAARPVDVGKASFETPDGVRRTRYFLLNASVGMVADGNARFNAGGPLLDRLKRTSTDAAIIWTVARSIAGYRPARAKLQLDDDIPFEATFANIGVIKRVHFAGGMYYDTPLEDDDGQFGVNLWGAASRTALVATIVELHLGRFRGRRGNTDHRARRVRLFPVGPANLELDGEVTPIRSAELTVLPKLINLCG